MVRLIGITGKAGSGKDSVADYLRAHHGYWKSAFADPLREAASRMFGVDPQHFTCRKLKEEVIPHWGMSPRRMLQLLGNDAVKPVFGDDIWIRRWKLAYACLGSDLVTVPDTRFDLEANAIRDLGGTVVHLIRPDAGLDGEAGAHISEAGVEIHKRDFVLHNTGDLADLYEGIEIMLEILKGGKH